MPTQSKLVATLKNPKNADLLLFFLQHISNKTLNQCGQQWKGTEGYVHKRLVSALQIDIERENKDFSTFSAFGGFDLLGSLEGIESLF